MRLFDAFISSTQREPFRVFAWIGRDRCDIHVYAPGEYHGLEQGRSDVFDRSRCRYALVKGVSKVE